MVNINKELIKKELSDSKKEGFKFQRDVMQLDYWFIFRKRDKKKK